MEVRQQDACCSIQQNSRPDESLRSPPSSHDGFGMRKRHQQQHAAAPAAGKPAPGRRRAQQWRSGLLSLTVIAAVLRPGCCTHLKAGDAQDRAFEDLSMLARAGQIITDAMVDAASAISSGTQLPASGKAKHPKGSSNAQVLPEPLCLQHHCSESRQRPTCSSFLLQYDGLPSRAGQALCHARQDGKRGKKPAHGGVPFWFKGNDGRKAEAKSATLHLEGNRRMLRRQKQHHHSAEDEWLKVHRYVWWLFPACVPGHSVQLRLSPDTACSPCMHSSNISWHWVQGLACRCLCSAGSDDGVQHVAGG